MDWEAKKKESERKREEERLRLIAMLDFEAESLPVPDRYQRIRYLREIEAAIWLVNLKRGLPEAQEEPVMRYKRRYSKTKIMINRNWDD